MTPTMVISSPLAHQDRVVTRDSAAPTAKGANVLIKNDAVTAGMPTAKKNGMMGTKPPIAVETLAETVDRQGLGKLSSESPSSSCTSVRRNCLGFFWSPSAIECASSAENPLSW